MADNTEELWAVLWHNPGTDSGKDTLWNRPALFRTEAAAREAVVAAHADNNELWADDGGTGTTLVWADTGSPNAFWATYGEDDDATVVVGQRVAVQE